MNERHLAMEKNYVALKSKLFLFAQNWTFSDLTVA